MIFKNVVFKSEIGVNYTPVPISRFSAKIDEVYYLPYEQIKYLRCFNEHSTYGVTNNIDSSNMFVGDFKENEFLSKMNSVRKQHVCCGEMNIIEKDNVSFCVSCGDIKEDNEYIFRNK